VAAAQRRAASRDRGLDLGHPRAPRRLVVTRTNVDVRHPPVRRAFEDAATSTVWATEWATSTASATE
jgi:hypothetical protein